MPTRRTNDAEDLVNAALTANTSPVAVPRQAARQRDCRAAAIRQAATLIPRTTTTTTHRPAAASS